jgi:hypothetical protein
MQKAVSVVNFLPVDDEEAESLRNSKTREITIDDKTIPIPPSIKPLRSPFLCMDPYETFITDRITPSTTDEDKVWLVLLIYLISRLSTLQQFGVPTRSIQSLNTFHKIIEDCLSNNMPFFERDWQAYNAEDLRSVMWTFCDSQTLCRLINTIKRKLSLTSVALILKTDLPQVFLMLIYS